MATSGAWVRVTAMEPRPWVRDFAPIVASFAACPLVALAGDDAAAGAVERGRELADTERAVGLFVEPALHAWASGQDVLMSVAGFAYLALHVPLLVGALAWVYLLHPAAFAPVRTLFLATQALTVAGWVLFPTAPPRLLGDPGFADTLVALWGPGAARQSTWLQSAYAAMPSGHVAFALVAGGAVAVLARRPVVRLAGGLYPLAVTGLTLVTANHLWLDAAGAVVVVAIAGAVTFAVGRTPRRWRVVAAEPG